MDRDNTREAGIDDDLQAGTAGNGGTQSDGNGGVRLLRRQFLQALGAAGLTAATGATGTAQQGGGPPGNGRDGPDGAGSEPTVQRRVTGEFRTRQAYSRAQLVADSDTSAHVSNGRLAEDVVVAKFGKSLPHDETTGLPATGAYEELVAATETGGEAVAYAAIRQAYEDAVPPTNVDLTDAAGGTLDSKPLVQPETAWTYGTEGGSTAQLRIAAPPAFDAPETGVEMVELYWRALTRDVHFRDYGDSGLVAAAAAELDSLDAYNGPGADGTVTSDTVFRGVTPGATTGPYVSQFLWKDRNLGGGAKDQKIEPQVVGDTTPSIDPGGTTVGPPTDYMTTVEDWLKVQRGIVPAVDGSLPGNEYADDRRHIVTGRDMCERVHDDPPFRQLQKAAQVLTFSMNAPLDEAVPYTLKPFDTSSPSRRTVANFAAQTTLPFNDFGPLYVEKKVLEATEHGQKAAWHKKWNVHRRLRPEEYGGRVQAVQGDGLSTPGSADLAARIPNNLLDSRALSLTEQNYGSSLLPQAYAEGSPTHPSYPAGHSVVAGAGVTVLKALFDGGYEFPTEEKVVPTRDGSELRTAAETGAMGVDETLTVRGELNKLASNMALGRNRAGIHYRTDGIEGLRLGEAAALRFLEDQLSLPNRVDGTLTLTVETFDGESVTVEPTV